MPIALTIFSEREKIISLSPFCEFCPKIELKRASKFSLSINLKILNQGENCWNLYFMLNKHIKTFRLNLNRYTRIRRQLPSNIALKIFSKHCHTVGPYRMGHTLGHTSTSFFTIYRQTETTRILTRKVSTNVVEQISNGRLVRTDLDGKNEKSPKRRSLLLNIIQHGNSIC